MVQASIIFRGFEIPRLMGQLLTHGRGKWLTLSLSIQVVGGSEDGRWIQGLYLDLGRSEIFPGGEVCRLYLSGQHGLVEGGFYWSTDRALRTIPKDSIRLSHIEVIFNH